MNLPFWRVRGGKVETNPPWMFQFHCEDSAKRVTVLNFFPFSRKHAARTHQFGGFQWGFKLWCHVSSTNLRSLENRGIFADGIAGKFLVLVKTRCNLIALHAKQLICISVRYPAKLNFSTQKLRRKVESLPPPICTSCLHIDSIRGCSEMKGTTASRSLSVESKSRKVCSTQRRNWKS